MSNIDSLSPLLGLLLMGDGLHDSDWGDQTNANLLLLEQAIAGVSVVQGLTGGTTALTAAQVAGGIVELQGALTSNQVVTVPNAARKWIFINQTTGAFKLSVQTVGGTGVAIDQGGSASLYSDGTNMNAVTQQGADPGTVAEWYGPELPSARWDWANGAPIDRTANATLFNAMTRVATATVGGAATVLPCTEDLTSKGFVGSNIEGVGIPGGAFITAVSTTAITISVATTGAATARNVRIFPFGNGDGATTFNKPDRAERVAVGRGNMGGVGDPNRLTTNTVPGGPTNLGTTAGIEGVTLNTTQIPAHTHLLTDPGHAHGTTEAPHTHVYSSPVTVTTEGGGTGGPKLLTTQSQFNTTPTSTGLTINTATTGITMASVGGGLAHSNVQPLIVCNFIVRLF